MRSSMRPFMLTVLTSSPGRHVWDPSQAARQGLKTAELLFRSLQRLAGPQFQRFWSIRHQRLHAYAWMWVVFTGGLEPKVRR